jgi:hypothetical protein
MLGIATVADRVAQTVVARHLGERAELVFHDELLWVPAGPVGSAGGRAVPGTMLEKGLGHRS